MEGRSTETPAMDWLGWTKLNLVIKQIPRPSRIEIRCNCDEIDNEIEEMVRIRFKEEKVLI